MKASPAQILQRCAAAYAGLGILTAFTGALADMKGVVNAGALMALIGTVGVFAMMLLTPPPRRR